MKSELGRAQNQSIYSKPIIHQMAYLGLKKIHSIKLSLKSILNHEIIKINHLNNESINTHVCPNLSTPKHV